MYMVRSFASNYKNCLLNPEALVQGNITNEVWFDSIYPVPDFGHLLYSQVLDLLIHIFR